MLSRMKFEIEPMVAEMLDQLPRSIWTSKTSTFFDPAIGGGQFVRAIEQRLRNAGHSDENIRSRVFGFEESDLHIRFAVNKYKLVGQYAKMSYNKFFELDNTMKFDVVVGNPPYQNPGKSKGEKLWYRFIFKTIDLVKDDGYLSLVTPNSWMSGGTNLSSGKRGVLKDIFKKYQLVNATVSGITKKYFKGVGIEISQWTVKKTAIHTTTQISTSSDNFVVDFKEIEFLSPDPDVISNSIVKKVFFSKDPKVTAIYFQKTVKRGTKKESKTKTSEFLYEHWLHGDGLNSTLETIFLEEKNSKSLEFKKILVPMGSRYWQPYYDNKKIGVASQGFAIPLNENDTYEGFLTVYQSKLFKYLNFNLQIQKNGFMKTSLVRNLPSLDLSKKWSDKAIYKHFGLSQEEIDYVETNVK